MNLTTKILVIGILAARRAKNLAYMAGWRNRNPNAKKIWDLKNKDHVSSFRKKYASENFQKRKQSLKKWKLKNMDRVRSVKRAWCANNRDKCRLMSKRTSNKMQKKYPHLALRNRLKAVIGHYIKRVGGKKHGESCQNIIGCDVRFFQNWIASKFLDGMDFSNRHLWQLDHIFPVSCCGPDEHQVRLAQNYLNFQPMWKHGNLEKGNKISSDSLIAAFLCGIKNIYLNSPLQASKEIISKARSLGFDVIESYKRMEAISA